jgi:hypothetical protein
VWGPIDIRIIFAYDVRVPKSFPCIFASSVRAALAGAAQSSSLHAPFGVRGLRLKFVHPGCTHRGYHAATKELSESLVAPRGKCTEVSVCAT